MAFEIPEFNPTVAITYDVDFTKDLRQYDIILGKDFLHKMGMKLNFSKGTIQWQNTKINMKDPT